MKRLPLALAVIAASSLAQEPTPTDCEAIKAEAAAYATAFLQRVRAKGTTEAEAAVVRKRLDEYHRRLLAAGCSD